MSDYTIKSAAGKLILIATILASGMAFLDGSVVNIAIPAIQSAFHANITDIQWVINSYALMLSALILISGSLGDKFGRKKIFLYGIALFTFSSFLCSIAQSIIQLALFRGLQGIGGAMMIPGSLSIIDSSFNESIRGRAIGLWSGFAGGIAALGPFLGGWLVQVFGWPSIFYLNVPLGLIAFLLTIRFVPETKNHDVSKIDFLGAILIFVSLLFLTYGLISGSDLGWNNGLIITSMLVGLFLFTLFFAVEFKSKEPLLPLNILKSSLVTGANISTLFLYFALSGVIFFLVLDLQQIQNYSPIQAGLSLLPAILIITFLSGPGGTIADKLGPRIPMILGPLIVALGMFLLTLAGRNVNYFLQIMPGLILFGIGMSLVIAPLTKSALAVDKKFSGAASGVNNAVSRIAGLLAVAFLGAIALIIFEKQLNVKIAGSTLNLVNQKQIITQQTKLGGIEMPKSFTNDEKVMAQNIIDDSFISSFRWVMGINVLLAFLSAVIAFFTIHNKGPKD